jgi:AcrR family transcriptional regulator
VTKSRSIAAQRDSGETKTRILDALGRLIVRDGLATVGINALAREAQADKVLIYRYFGDLDGV